jgi:hypothetical protein
LLCNALIHYTLHNKSEAFLAQVEFSKRELPF